MCFVTSVMCLGVSGTVTCGSWVDIRSFTFMPCHGLLVGLPSWMAVKCWFVQNSGGVIPLHWDFVIVVCWDIQQIFCLSLEDKHNAMWRSLYHSRGPECLPPIRSIPSWRLIVLAWIAGIAYSFWILPKVADEMKPRFRHLLTSDVLLKLLPLRRIEAASNTVLTYTFCPLSFRTNTSEDSHTPPWPPPQLKTMIRTPPCDLCHTCFCLSQLFS